MSPNNVTLRATEHGALGSRRLRRSLAALLPAVVLGAAVHAEPELTDAGRRALDAALEHAVTVEGIPGVVAGAFTVDGPIYLGAFGWRDVARRVPLTTDSIFRIASMTKPITSVALMMLEESGHVELDDAVARYLPEFANKTVFASFDAATLRYTERPAARPLTVRHLLSHTSGLGYAWADPILHALLAAGDASTSAAALPLLHDPGARWTYGESTRAVGQIVEAIADQPLEAYLRERIFTPLGMTDTAHAVPADKQSRVVTTHVREDGRFLESANGPDSYATAVRGDGGLYSTAADYGRFIAMLLRGGRAEDGFALLEPATVALMGEDHIAPLRVERHVPATTRSRPFPQGAGEDGFGLGFQITAADQPDGRSAGSLSWAGIQNTYFWIDPARGVGAVLLMQYLPFFDALALETLQRFESVLYQHLETAAPGS